MAAKNSAILPAASLKAQKGAHAFVHSQRSQISDSPALANSAQAAIKIKKAARRLPLF
jgi:hypothetical protein